MRRLGRLRADTFRLNIHDAPNGNIIDDMRKEDRFVLDDHAAQKNPGGEKWWVRGSVTINHSGAHYDHVWVSDERLEIEMIAEPLKPDPDVLKRVPQPPYTPPPTPPRLLRPFEWLLYGAVGLLLSLLGYCSFAHAQPSWCSGNCGGTSPPWTLYLFERDIKSGFVQQKLSSHDSLEKCEGHAGDERYYHIDQIVSARCVPYSNAIGKTKIIKDGPTEVGYY